MELKYTLIFSKDLKTITWVSKDYVRYNDIKIGKIKNVSFNKEKGCVDIIFKVFPKHIKQMKKLLKVN